MSSRIPIAIFIIAVVVALALGAGFVMFRAMHREARALASRLTGCPADEIEVEMLQLGDTDTWHVHGCGITGVLTCEPTDAGCIIVPDAP